MLATIKMRDYFNPSALTVPSIIVKNDLTGPFFYVTAMKDKKLIAKKIYVKIGISDGINTIIEEGVSENQRAIVKGYNLVKTGVQIKFKSE